MSGARIKENTYKAGNISIRIGCGSRCRFSSLQSYLALDPCEGRDDPRPDATLTLLESGTDMLDKLIPLPGEEYLISENTLLVDRPVPYRVYTRGSQRWSDFSGFGRSLVDRERGLAKAVILRENGISPVYTDILFGYNLLMGLLHKFGYMSVHASCVRIGGQGVLFTGKSGSGKSTAACAMLSRGHPVLADDRILLRKESGAFSALSISDVVKLDSRNIGKFFPGLASARPLHLVKNELYLKITSTENLRYAAKARIESLIVFERTGLAMSRAENISPSRVVGDLFPVTIGDHRPDETSKKFNFLMELLETVSCYRVYFGTDMGDFVRCIENITGKEI